MGFFVQQNLLLDGRDLEVDVRLRLVAVLVEADGGIVLDDLLAGLIAVLDGHRQVQEYHIIVSFVVVALIQPY